MLIDRSLVEAALPGYSVEGDLGRGGYGLVLAGQHRLIGRKVAIKILLDTSDDADLRARFLSEARVLAELDHPHIVRIHDYVEHEGTCLLVMELLSGGTLKQRISSGPLSPETTCSIGIAAAAALATAHGQGVLHRDVKPDNIMFTGDGLLKVTDFGIAKIFDGAETTASAILGTPRYMAPEQIMGVRLFPSTDLYALAGVLYEMFAGRPLFGRQMAVQPLTHHHLTINPEPLTMVPPPVSMVIMRALAKDPTARFGDASDFALELARAGARAFGPNWLSRSDVKVRVEDEIREAALGGSTTPRPATPGPGRVPGPLPVPGSGPLSGAGPRPGPLGPGYSGGAPASGYSGGQSGPAGPGGQSRPSGPGGPSVPGGRVGQSVPGGPGGRVGPSGPGGPVGPGGSNRAGEPGGQGRPGGPGLPVAGGPVPGRSYERPPGQGGPVKSSPVHSGPAQGPPAGGYPPAGGFAGRPPGPPGADDSRFTQAPTTRAGGPGQPAGWGGFPPVNTPQPPVAGSRTPPAQPLPSVPGQAAAGPFRPGPIGPASHRPPSGAPGGRSRLPWIIAAVAFVLVVAVTVGIVLAVANSGGDDRGTTTTRITATGYRGAALTVQGLSPYSLYLDQDGSLLVSSLATDRVQRITPAGTSSDYAGTGSGGFSGDGGPAASAQLDGPGSTVRDKAGDLYIGDAKNNRIRKVNPAGVITTVVGTGTAGFGGDGGPATAAQINSTEKIAVGPDGSLFLSDYENHRIRKVDPNGIITTYAGTGTAGYTGAGGQATAARIDGPNDLAVTSDGTVYFADLGSSTIQKITPNGIITTIAGTGQKGYSGDGGPATAAKLNVPSLTLGVDGKTFYLADYNNNRVRRIDPNGIITTIAGTGTKGLSGDGGPATAAQFENPSSIAIDGSGNIYVADNGNDRVRRIDPNGTISTIARP
ncbi:eukaryotic-like serine/threonine-protein kinase [Frankia sp. AiPs1]|uniref:serine/threonine-protein kinase n=1 Tax=Frankia sp. AiPa1 TaxID=573492 RepID=UPI00202B8AF5|nr:serine/threonine-protein kinase [Frankia sp. AiPa1]MCL9760746.1 protein kinase [Frankia sp. AiPa1]